MFKNVPKELYGNKDPISVTLHEMDRFGIEIGLIGATWIINAGMDDFTVAAANALPNRGCALQDQAFLTGSSEFPADRQADSAGANNDGLDVI